MEGDETVNEIKRNSNNMGNNEAHASTPVSSTSFHVKPVAPMMMPMIPTMKASPPVPTLKIKPISSNSKNNMGRNDMNLNGKNDGVGEQFSEPGFFPSFDRFKRIKM
ncbi:unnamed protein product [Orchesella dallaii]|uniref:Uncharacterized protein n=1 Tax=Orchesella dallaii TaxID=48710 RepID=A0ABP1RYH9_9HEXA